MGTVVDGVCTYMEDRMPKYDDELIATITRPEWLDSLREKVVVTEGRWVWQWAINGSGYPVFRQFVPSGSDVYLAHRLAWMHVSGRVPAELEQIDHTCRVRACVNPAHLQATTHSENNRLVGARNRTAKSVRLATAASIRLRITTSGRERFSVLFRDYTDDQMVQRSRTFDTRAEAEEFRSHVSERPVSDLVAS